MWILECGYFGVAMSLKYLGIISVLLLQTGCNSQQQPEQIASSTLQVQPSNTPSTQPVAESGGKITGKQYMVLGKGAVPIADNKIAFIPCSDMAQCSGEMVNFSTIASGANSQIYKDEKLNFIISATKSTDERLSGRVKYVNTNFDGDFDIDCPSKYCIVYSIGQAGFSAGLYVGIGESGKRLDLSNSNMITSIDK
jgi:hypothetical protein